MQSQFMMINPTELEIDMPVNENTVESKMKSLQENGMIQPVTVWLNGLRIIDGFHRTVAAQRLGWQEIPCNVIDCAEEGFWDARIQSARQHHEIERNRLSTWIVNCWQSTQWDEDLLSSYILERQKDDSGFYRIADDVRSGRADDFDMIDFKLLEFRTKLSKPERNFYLYCNEHNILRWSEVSRVSDEEILSLDGVGLKCLQKLRDRQEAAQRALDSLKNPLLVSFINAHGVKKASLALALWAILQNERGQKTLLPNQITEWFSDKAERWGESAGYIATLIIDSPFTNHIVNSWRLRVSLDAGLPLEVAMALDDEIPLYENKDLNKLVPKYVEEFAKTAPSNQRLGQYIHDRVNEKTRERNDFFRDFAAVPVAPDPKEELRAAVNRAFFALSGARWAMPSVPEMPLLLGQHIEATKKLILEFYPDSEVQTEANPIWMENLELRQKVAVQAEQIASLQRALRSKVSIKEVAQSARALSSVEIEAL